nr:Na+/H+ antiporter NhaA [Pseudonocardia sp. EV170527-09]
MVWANLGAGYESFWHTGLAVSFGDAALDLDLRHWVNDGLMVLFFLSVGLEIARETTLGVAARVPSPGRTGRGCTGWPRRTRVVLPRAQRRW